MNRINANDDIHIIPTVVLLKSLGMARYMSRNMKHVHISDDLIKRIQKAPDKVKECVRIAKDTVSEIKKNGFSGAMISTIGWEDRLYDIIHGI
jgi:5,10-methylenetetrahydrofolate reductase